MEILMDNNETSQYYDEVLDISSNYNKIIKNPRKKFSGSRRYALTLTGIAFVFLAIFSLLTFTQKSSIYFYVMVFFAVTFALGVIYYIMILNNISKLKNRDISRKLILENDHIEFIVGDEEYRLEKSDIQYVLINRYSISFIPKTKTNNIFFADIKYKSQILENFNEKSLIVDNSDLY